MAVIYTWKNVRLPEIDGKASQELKDRHAALAERVTALIEAREQLTNEVTAARNAPIAELTERNFSTANRIRGKRGQLLEDEIQLRQDIDAWDREHRAEVNELRAEVKRQMDEAREAVTADLVAIGYHPDRILPVTVNVNDRVRNLQLRLNELNGRHADYGVFHENREAIEQATEDLEAARRALVAI